MKMNHLIFTAVLTACLGIGGYQQGPEFFGPSPEGLGHDPHYDPGQLISSNSSSWPPLVSPHFTLSIAVYTSMYYVLMYFARSFGRYNLHAKAFCWLMTIYPIITALTGFQFANLLPYLLQVVPTLTGYYTVAQHTKRQIITNQILQEIVALNQHGLTWEQIATQLQFTQATIMQEFNNLMNKGNLIRTAKKPKKAPESQINKSYPIMLGLLQCNPKLSMTQVQKQLVHHGIWVFECLV
ncbi:hypothetical protein DSO57_1020817 [Entomophthora muscae]|uniref:Uncharacterized protein n=1 Tax=Entomophthora muscae TaxID=34485 RepID=A0ACC2U1Z5_9FUNG|nr:hypothetical protein DSO57_1020817 [Entomophthora muscae]